jgi:hypothetical protein
MVLEKGTVYSEPLILLFAAFAEWVLTDARKTRSQFLRRQERVSLCAARHSLCFHNGWRPGARSRGFRHANRKQAQREKAAYASDGAAVVLSGVVSRSPVCASLCAFAIKQTYTGGLFDSLGLWNQLGTDSQHYLNIAQNGYVATGDDRLLIVFFPQYPYLVRGVHFLIDNYLVSGLIVSNLCWVFAAYLLYELALMDNGQKGALRR